MSFYQDLTYIGLTGPKPVVRRMLNAVIAHLGAKEPILEADSLEEINRKLLADDGYCFRIALPDLLDDEAMRDPLLLQKKQEFEAKKPELNEEICFSCRAIDITRMKEHYDEYTVEFCLYESEYGYYCDFLDWEDIARLFGCVVCVDDELYNKGCLVGLDSSTIYRPLDGEVQTIKVHPDIDLIGFNGDFGRLIRFNPERYIPLKIRHLEDALLRIQNELKEERVRALLPEMRRCGGHLVVPSSMKSVASALDGCDELRSLAIEDGVEVLEPCAFYRCKNLSSAKIAPSVREIGRACFALCSSLEEVELPEGLRELGERAFEYCSSLRHIILPASLETIGEEVFKGSPLEHIEVRPGSKHFSVRGNCLLDASGKKLLLGRKNSVIPEGVEEVADSAFIKVIDLEEIRIPDGVTKIGSSVFMYCENLAVVYFPASVREIGKYLFTACESLKEIHIHDASLLAEARVPEGARIITD